MYEQIVSARWLFALLQKLQHIEHFTLLYENIVIPFTELS